jgi:hypothetical protein
MRHLGNFAAAGLFALMGIGAATLSASAATLGLQFTGTPNSTNNNAGNNGTAYGYNLVDINTSITVTGLGEFVNGSLSNVSTQGGQINSSPAGDWVYMGTGTVPTSSNSFASSALFSVELFTGTTPDVTLVGTYWAFASIAPQVLAAGHYWIAVVYGDPNTSVFSTSAVNAQTGISLLGGATCSTSSACNGTTGETFGPNFEDNLATPLPAALPLFAGGLGLLGMFARRKKRTTSVLAA